MTITSPPLASLADGCQFEGFYVVKESSFQTAVNGKNYIRMTLADASGALPANIWDVNRDLYQLCPSGSIVKVQGIAESYKGKPQIRVGRFRPAHDSEVDLDAFLPKTARDVGEMTDAVLALADSLQDQDYHRLAASFFGARHILDRFVRAPAARDVHHAYLGGLLEHTLNVAAMADAFGRSAHVDRDLLVIGALLHDIGKIDELSAKFSIEYTDRGKLLGHLFIGAEMVRDHARELDLFPAEKLLLVQHLILSHHGRYEYGSPVLPKIPEAFALHHLDNLDAKVETANRLLDNIRDEEKTWTDYSRALETQLYQASGREPRQ
ncbi:MAG: CRISPR-associated endonuclease Cas3'' [Planctomycetes bacterium]|nr:CRISPR-associated endonuclease Cas3'' [Planctomycetota bacterium]MCD7896885.1 CRISPR-associated endonuclease Cas3'' [Planctomycetaceae bacterium]